MTKPNSSKPPTCGETGKIPLGANAKRYAGLTDGFSLFGKRFSVVGRRCVCGWAMLLLLGTLLTFQGLRHCGFVDFDDGLYVTENRVVQEGLSFESVHWSFTTFHAANWSPLTWLSLQLDSQLFGTTPCGYHVTNLLWHALNVLLLFSVFITLTKNVWPSFLTAAIFAVHPLHVESVAWISERKDVLSTFSPC